MRQDAAADDRDDRADDVARRRQLGKERQGHPEQLPAKRRRRPYVAAALAAAGAGEGSSQSQSDGGVGGPTTRVLKRAATSQPVPSKRARQQPPVSDEGGGAHCPTGTPADVCDGADVSSGAPADVCGACDEADAPDSDEGGDGSPAAQPRRVRTDAVLRLRPAALASLRAVLRCTDLCTAEARRARGEG